MDLLKIRAICVVIDLTMIDVCSKRSLTSSNGLNLISPLFPNEYPNNLNCTCSIDTKKKSHSAKSNGSNDSGIEDSEPIKCEQTTCFFCFFDSSDLGYF